MGTARLIPSEEIRIDPLLSRRVAVLGYGAQGSAHALNLRDSGVRVLVGQRPGPRFDEARSAGFEPLAVPDAVQQADLVIFGLPDDSATDIYEREIRPSLRAGQALGFLHGFVIHYQRITPPADVDVLLLAPKGQGSGVRREFLAGRGVAALVAVQQDASGQAIPIALGWAAGIGAGRACVYETTFADETETDLFGEQAVLCGGVSELIHAAFETLVEAGYPPELAYFECCHELKLITDLIYTQGIAGMRRRISTTARFGDLTRGPRVIDANVRAKMREALAEIRSGAFAREFLADVQAGRPRARALAERGERHAIEEVGARLRAAMWRGQIDAV